MPPPRLPLFPVTTLRGLVTSKVYQPSSFTPRLSLSSTSQTRSFTRCTTSTAAQPTQQNVRYRTYSSYSSSSDDAFNPSTIITILKYATFTVGTTLFLTYFFDTRAGIHKHVIMPLVHTWIDPEEAHKLSIWLASKNLIPKEKVIIDDDSLKVEIWGKTLSNPIGLAAGCDKNGEAVDGLLNVGFGFVEVGSVTPEPQEGNPKPRMFRLTEDQAAINRYGLNSDGHQVVASRLAKRVLKHQVGEGNASGMKNKLVGVNLGKNKTSPTDSNRDYILGVENLGPYADYLVVNVSCPNVSFLKDSQQKDKIAQTLLQVKEARDNLLPHRPPILVKLAPNLSQDQLVDIANVLLEVKPDGVIISNTTPTRPESLKASKSLQSQFGGLSGPPVKPLALASVKTFYKATQGRVPIIGCGGISNADDAIEFARAGASLVELYTSFSYQGPGMVTEMKMELKEKLKGMNKKWSDLIGEDVR